jgi:hypothetical protein
MVYVILWPDQLTPSLAHIGITLMRIPESVTNALPGGINEVIDVCMAKM